MPPKSMLEISWPSTRRWRVPRRNDEDRNRVQQRSHGPLQHFPNTHTNTLLTNCFSKSMAHQPTYSKHNLLNWCLLMPMLNVHELIVSIIYREALPKDQETVPIHLHRLPLLWRGGRWIGCLYGSIGNKNTNALLESVHSSHLQGSPIRIKEENPFPNASANFSRNSCFTLE